MSTPTGVFLSTVTSEFGTIRDALASDLRAKQYDVTVQEDFRQERGTSTTLDKLDAYIRTCEAVVCVIGTRSGSVPPPAAAAPYTALLPDGLAEASYTQWELLFALHHGKQLFKYHATDRYVPDLPEPTGEDHPELQARFVRWLFEERGFDRTEFSTADELRIEVLKTDLGSVRGERRSATLTGVGLAVQESVCPRPRRRSVEDANRLKPNRHPLVGRDDELETLVAEIDARHEQLVMLVGEAGIGKKALLQELTHSGELPSDFPDGAAVNPLVDDPENPEDLRQAIWEEFYEFDEPGAVAPRQRLKDLRDLEALVFLPDLDGSLESLGEVLDDMTDTVFCVTATEAATRDLPGEEIPIEGLDDDEMIEVFEDRYRDPVPAEVRGEVVALCRASGGNPGQIELLAKEARKDARRHADGDQHPLVAWATARAAGVVSDRPASAGEDRAAAALRAAGGQVPREALARVAGSADVIDEAVEDGRFEEGSPRYRLNPVLVPAASEQRDGAPDGDPTLDELFDAAVGWAGRAVHAEIYENRAFVLRMMDWGLRSGWRLLERRDDPRSHVRAYARWRRVIRLGRSAEPAMALGGRHGAWDRLLQLVQVAARSTLELADGTDRDAPPTEPATGELSAAQRSAREALGWALHQRGSRALLRDELDDARTYLNEALRHRVDDGARLLARRNLTLVPLAVIPFAALVVGCLLVASVATALLTPFEDEPATVDITPDVADFASGDVAVCHPAGGPATVCLEVRNVGSGPVWIGSIEIGDVGAVDEVGERAPVAGFEIAHADVTDRCDEGRRIEEDGSCWIAVVSDGTAPTALLSVQVESRSGERAGDRSVVLLGGS